MPAPDRDIELLREVFEHCTLMAKKCAAEHVILAQRFFGRAEGLHAVLELMEKRSPQAVRNLIAIRETRYAIRNKC